MYAMDTVRCVKSTANAAKFGIAHRVRLARNGGHAAESRAAESEANSEAEGLQMSANIGSPAVRPSSWAAAWLRALTHLRRGDHWRQLRPVTCQQPRTAVGQHAL